MGYPEPPAAGGEAETLLGSLERQRATFAWKCADLDEAGLRAVVGVSAVTLGGLLRHLAFMEDVNFTRDLAGRELPARWAAPPDAPEGWEWAPAGEGPELLRTGWLEAVERSRTAVAEALAAGGPGGVFAVGGRKFGVRRLLMDMIEEYARHVGQADLLREAVDGRTGEDPPGRPYPYRMP